MMSAFATDFGSTPAILGVLLSLVCNHVFPMIHMIRVIVGSLRVIQGLCLLGHKILLHPLRNYPGPLVAKFTDGYAGYFAIKKRLHLVTYRDHLKYGKYAFLLSNELVTARKGESLIHSPRF